MLYTRRICEFPYTQLTNNCIFTYDYQIACAGIQWYLFVFVNLCLDSLSYDKVYLREDLPREMKIASNNRELRITANSNNWVSTVYMYCWISTSYTCWVIEILVTAVTSLCRCLSLQNKCLTTTLISRLRRMYTAGSLPQFSKTK